MPGYCKNDFRKFPLTLHFSVFQVVQGASPKSYFSLWVSGDMKGMPSVPAKSEPSHPLLNSLSGMTAALEVKICKTSLIPRKQISPDFFFSSML